MPQFRYSARDQVGKQVSGVFEAPNETIAQEMMREQQLILVSLNEVKERDLKEAFQELNERVRTKDVVIFARQLSVLISSTVPIVRSLRILEDQTQSKILQRVIGEIADEVDGGARLSAAMHQHQRIFDDFFVYMIRAGETTGRLDEVLEYLADQKEKDYELTSSIISSMIYPAFVIGALILVFVFMMIFVLPQLLGIIEQSNAELPLPTTILLWTSNALQQWGWLMGILVVAAIGGVVALRYNPAGKKILDQVKLKIPIVGKIFHRIYLTRINRSLSNLLASGVPVTRSIEITSDVVGNSVLKEVLLSASREVEAGQTLSSSLAHHDEIPPMMSQMMSVGEETGRVDEILSRIAEFYEGEVKSLSDALVSLVEPIVIILLGIGALILVSGILLPIYSVTSGL